MNIEDRSCTIAHLSDLHTGSQYFVPNLLDRTLVEVNDLAPDIVVVTGDLTNMGYRQEFREAREYLDRLTCTEVLVVPGNHDRLVPVPEAQGWGKLARWSTAGEWPYVHRYDRVSLIGLSSALPTAPLLASGRLGSAQCARLGRVLAQEREAGPLRRDARHVEVVEDHASVRHAQGRVPHPRAPSFTCSSSSSPRGSES